MKTLFLILVCAIAASAQANLACQIDTAPPGANDTLALYGGYTMPTHTPKWTQSPANTQTIKLNGGQAWRIFIYMGVAGNCEGSFDSRDDRSDAMIAVTSNLEKYIPPPTQPVGEIEIMIVDEYNLQRMDAGGSYSAIYTTNRQYSGSFNWRLDPGRYYLVINNNFQHLAAKSVTLTLGSKDIKPKPLAPTFAPLKTETRTNQTNSNESDTPPKLRKRPKTKP